MSPILVRPVREQFEHDRVIRVLQARYKRKFEVVINPGAGTERVGRVSARSPCYPDLVLYSQERGRRLQGTVEVETGESVNTLEAMAEWGPFSRLRAALSPVRAAQLARYRPPPLRRTSDCRHRNLDLSHGRRPGALHHGAIASLSPRPAKR